MTTESSMTVTRVIDASAADLFEKLSNPEHHAEIDGSGFIRGDEKTDRITETGQVFTMNMTGDHMGGDYQTENHVTGYDHNKLLAWQTAPAGQEPPGWEWVWELEPEGSDSTKVTLTYDWSRVTDPEILKMVSFPLISQKQLEESLGHLAEIV